MTHPWKRYEGTGRAVAHWSTSKGKYWLELIEEANGTFSYRHENGGGYLGHVMAGEAYQRMEAILADYLSDGHKLHQRLGAIAVIQKEWPTENAGRAFADAWKECSK